jgi:hypothetical protein
VGRNSSRRSETDLTIPCASFEFLMRVLFIQNNGIQESIGVANPSGILKANGHETDLLLVSHTNDLIGAIKRSDPGLIAFSALTGVHHSLQQLDDQATLEHPDHHRRPAFDIFARHDQ